MLFKRAFVGVLLTVLATTSFATDWELKKSDDELGIKVYTRAVDGSPLREFKGETQLKSSLNAAVALVRDTTNLPSWMHKMQSVKVLKKISDQETITYSVTEVGPFMDDRDNVVHSTTEQDPTTKAVTLIMTAKPDYIPAEDGKVRVAAMNGFWKLTPKDGGMVEVVFQVHADPAGSLPEGLINTFVVENPYNSLANMHEQIGEYQGKAVAFITE